MEEVGGVVLRVRDGVEELQDVAEVTPGFFEFVGGLLSASNHDGGGVTQGGCKIDGAQLRVAEQKHVNRRECRAPGEREELVAEAVLEHRVELLSDASDTHAEGLVCREVAVDTAFAMTVSDVAQAHHAERRCGAIRWQPDLQAGAGESAFVQGAGMSDFQKSGRKGLHGELRSGEMPMRAYQKRSVCQ